MVDRHVRVPRRILFGATSAALAAMLGVNDIKAKRKQGSQECHRGSEICGNACVAKRRGSCCSKNHGPWCPDTWNCCGAGCCAPDSQCCGTFCCDLGSPCCGDVCCSSGALCCPPSTMFPKGICTVAGGRCCPEGNPCTPEGHCCPSTPDYPQGFCASQDLTCDLCPIDLPIHCPPIQDAPHGSCNPPGSFCCPGGYPCGPDGKCCPATPTMPNGDCVGMNDPCPA